MNMISALLLQLIQASSHGVIAKIKKLRANALELELSGKAGATKEALKEVSLLIVYVEKIGTDENIGGEIMSRCY